MTHNSPSKKRIFVLTNASRKLFEIVRGKTHSLAAYIHDISTEEYNRLANSFDARPFAITDSLLDGDTVIYRDLTKNRERFMIVHLVQEVV